MANKIKTLQELQEIRERVAKTVVNRKTLSPEDSFGGGECPKHHVLVCGGTGCVSGGGRVIFDEFKVRLVEHELETQVKMVFTGCFGLCAKGPIVVVYPDGTFYQLVEQKDVEEIVREHLIGGKPVARLASKEKDECGNEKTIANSAFYKSQHKIVLQKCGLIDPENIDEYLAYDGYLAYEKAVRNMSQDELIENLKASGLRGRGGGGFTTGMKWQFAKNSVSDQKYVVCNADEGDPGAFMDRSILEGDPHAVIEAMMIAGYAIGATMGYVYVRAEYPIAVDRLKVALEQAREYGILGKNAMGLGFEFDIDIRLGAGAFVCGEETALLRSIEGGRGEPKQRPPFPAVKGLFDKPTLINNVETLAAIPHIILKGPMWFSSIGTEKSKGTKVFALGGKIKNTGLVEIPMGTTLRTVIEEIGEGIPGGKKFKAAQTGGPSGGCISASHMDSPIDFDALIELGSMMGSGGLIVMDEDNCMVDIAKFYLEFTVEESCGKCTPCRIGNKRLYELLEKVSEGTAEVSDLDKMEQLSKYIKENSLCGLGQTAPNPVLSTLKYFRDEYMSHVVDKKCPAGVCTNLLTYSILQDKCIGCTLCQRACPVGAISGELKKPETFVIDVNKCIKCDACVPKCKFKAIVK